MILVAGKSGPIGTREETSAFFRGRKYVETTPGFEGNSVLHGDVMVRETGETIRRQGTTGGTETVSMGTLKARSRAEKATMGERTAAVKTGEGVLGDKGANQQVKSAVVVPCCFPENRSIRLMKADGTGGKKHGAALETHPSGNAGRKDLRSCEGNGGDAVVPWPKRGKRDS